MRKTKRQSSLRTDLGLASAKRLCGLGRQATISRSIIFAGLRASEKGPPDTRFAVYGLILQKLAPVFRTPANIGRPIRLTSINQRRNRLEVPACRHRERRRLDTSRRRRPAPRDAAPHERLAAGPRFAAATRAHAGTLHGLRNHRWTSARTCLTRVSFLDELRQLRRQEQRHDTTGLVRRQESKCGRRPASLLAFRVSALGSCPQSCPHRVCL